MERDADPPAEEDMLLGPSARKNQGQSDHYRPTVRFRRVSPVPAGPGDGEGRLTREQQSLGLAASLPFMPLSSDSV